MRWRCLRWGKLVGATPVLQAHGPGLLFAFPRPMDQVVRVQVKRVREISVDTLQSTAAVAVDDDDAPVPGAGDHNIVHVAMVARYRVKDPAEWAFYGPKSEEALRVEVTAAMVRSLGEMGVDRVLSDGRKTLIATATKRAQAGLDATHTGLELSSLELTRLGPPQALATEFDAVQSAFYQCRNSEEAGTGVCRAGDSRSPGSGRLGSSDRAGRGGFRTCRCTGSQRSVSRVEQGIPGERRQLSGSGFTGTPLSARSATPGWSVGYPHRSAAATEASA